MESLTTVDNKIKIVVVGDPLVGKSCSIANFETAIVPAERQSTIFDSSNGIVNIDGSIIPLSIWDTSGKTEYIEMVKPVYRDANIFLLFFSVVSPDTYQNALLKWYVQVNNANPKALKIFVGNKIDLRRNSIVQNAVQKNIAQQKIQKQMKCQYLQCSGFTGEGLREIFQKSARAHLNLLNSKTQVSTRTKKPNEASCCTMM